MQPGISQPVISPEGHEVEAFSKNSCDDLGTWGQPASALSRGDRTAKELRGGCVVEKRAEKGSSRGTGRKGKSPFSRKRLLQLSMMSAAHYPGKNVLYSAPQRQKCRSRHCTEPCTMLWTLHACSMQMACLVVICV